MPPGRMYKFEHLAAGASSGSSGPVAVRRERSALVVQPVGAQDDVRLVVQHDVQERTVELECWDSR